MKKLKTKLIMGLSVLIIGFLISTSSLSVVSTKALVNEKNNQYYTDSFERFIWKWNTTEVVSIESTELSNAPSLAVDSTGNIHIVWHDVTDYAGAGTDYDIFYKRFDSSTFSWSTTEVVSTESTGYSIFPSLAVDSAGNVHIAWHDFTNYAGAGTDYDIFYKHWDASTTLWNITEVVSTESTDGSYFPSLAVDSTGNVHIAWSDETDYAGAGTDEDIFYKHWDSASSWSTTEVVSTESTANSQNTVIAVDSAGNVHIAWSDYTDYAGAGTDMDIFYKRWDSSTSSWTTTEFVSTESTVHSYAPSLAVDSAGHTHIVWRDYSNYAGSGTDQDIFYKRWDSASTSWTITEVVSTESTANSLNPSLVVDSAGHTHIVWRDLTDYAGSGTDDDIFYKRWDSASSWSTTEVVSTESTSDSASSSLAVDSTGSVHIAWHDYTDYAGAGTDQDIFYKKLAGLPVAPELAFIVPNPTEIDTVYLDWNKVLGVTSYHVYRSPSYIWFVEGLVPITTVSSSEYSDTVPSEGFYYYVVVAESFAGNSSHSNCQYVEVKLADLEAPELAPLLPNPTDSSSVSLEWDSIDGAIEYHIYRSDTYIWSVESLAPIATEGSTSYIDNLPSEGYYFYVIVANDGVSNSTHSNCEYVEYKVPHLREFSIVTGLIFASFVLVFVVTRIRKRNFKPN